jgi:hypothetical protein
MIMGLAIAVAEQREGRADLCDHGNGVLVH